jgi:IS30 family transposase
MLSPADVLELVKAYPTGQTMRSLAQQFGVHPDTVSRHGQRAGVRRPVVKVTASVLARARQLYEQGWSTPQIGRELGIGSSSIAKKLRQSGVQMRPPVV